jgi:hypothetical protein
MTEFVFWNWVLCSTTFILLAVSILRQRFLLIKPSILVIVFFHFMVQWSSTVQAGYIESYLPNPWAFMLLVHGFPLIGFCVTFFTWRRQAFHIWRRVTKLGDPSPKVIQRVMLILGGCIVVFLAYYLRTVPFSSTGLHAILFNPTESTLAREESLKLIDNPIVQYGYGLTSSAAAPLLAVILTISLLKKVKHWRLTGALLNATAILGLLFVVSLTGARIYAAVVLLAVVFALWLKNGLPIRPVPLALAGVVVLIIPVLLSLLRQGAELNASSFLYYLTTGGMGRRVFVVPTMVGMWYVDYTQTQGFVGVAGIPKLASLLGVEPVIIQNIIGLKYMGTRIESVHATVGYVFAYFAYFGPLSLALSLIGLWLLDLMLLGYRRLGDSLLLPCVAAVSVSCSRFVGSDYTTVLITHGFLISFVVALVVDRASRVVITSASARTAQGTVGHVRAPETDGRSVAAHLGAAGRS